MQLYTTNLIDAKHAFSTRKGGISRGAYASLNLAYHVGDDAKSVTHNRLLLAKVLGYEPSRLTFMHQLHSTTVRVVDETSPQEVACDAIVSNQKGKALMVMGADCAPVLFYDKRRGVAAAAHVGRKGAFGNIVANVLETMNEYFGVKSNDVAVAVGPRICKKCYEVSQKEVDEAKRLGFDFALEGFLLDIDAIIKHQLLAGGVERFDFTPFCTKCDNETFFSYRAHSTTGRQAGVIVLENNIT